MNEFILPMKTKLLLLLLSFVLIIPQLKAEKEHYKIEIKVEGLTDSVAYLAYYFGKGQYYRDTANIDDKGWYVFESNDTLEHGMYSFVADNSKLFDFMVDVQEIVIQTDLENTIQNIKFEGGKENQLFFEYMSFLNEKQLEASAIEEEKKESEGKKLDDLNMKMTALDNEVKTFIDKFHEKYDGSFSSNFLKALAYPEVPEPPLNEDGSVDSTFTFRYFKDHFWDDYDFSDQRLLHTSTYHEKLKYFLSKLFIQNADSIIKAVDIVLEKAKVNEQMLKYTLTYLTSKYERIQQMGMDAVFVHLVKKYYMKGVADDWLDDKQLNKLAERALALDPLLIGKKAPNIIVKDTSMSKYLELYDVKANYTVVYIWSATCGHCKVATPKLKKVYDQYKQYGFEVFGVGSEFENKEWLEFIRKHELNWLNGSDGGAYKSNFRTTYDVYSTPQTYLLDKDKKILAKKMNIFSLENILRYYLENDGIELGDPILKNDENSK